MAHKPCIWITRSEPGASLLQAALTAGLALQADVPDYDIWVAPVLNIEPLGPWRCRQMQVDNCGTWLHGQLPAGGAPAWVIVLSAHAARAYVAAGLPQHGQQAQYIAIGEATAAVLKPHVDNIILPDIATSEGVLACLQQQLPSGSAQQTGARVWLIAGQDGRDVLARGLLDRWRAEVVEFQLYRRVARQVGKIPVERISMIVTASAQGLQSMAQQWYGTGGAATVKLLVPSARVVQKARQLGFQQVYNVQSASTDAVVAAITSMDNRA